MITLPETPQEGDLVRCTVNSQLGWLRVATVFNNIVTLASFMPQGARQQQTVNNPNIVEPTLLIRGDVVAGSVFEALVKTVGISAAVQAAR